MGRTAMAVKSVGKVVLLLSWNLISTNVAADNFWLPVEVLGSEGTTTTRTFSLTQEQVDQTENLFFFANNLGYENKGSIQINGGDWVRLNHADINIYEKERHVGGMTHGGMNSIRFTIPDTNLVAGSNAIKFRFDTSNGISIGYRIFKFNLLDAAGKNLLPESFFKYSDPNSWRAPRGYRNSKAVAAGKDLWYNAKLRSHNLPDGRYSTWYGNELLPQQDIKATCSDCHTQDGRDLQYFSYSNKAIKERSQFHGLSGDQGKKIAAYIRSLDVPNHGRPWNPPYQPGPSVGEKPVEYWAAGAGIDAVLENDADMLPYMFPNGTSQKELDSYFDSGKMHDTTTVPIAIQFPDWKHWLPLIHPKDAFDGFYSVQQDDGSFIAGDAWHKHNPFIHYPALRAYLEANRDNLHDLIAEDPKLEFYPLMGNFWSSFRKFFAKRVGSGGGWRYNNAVADRYWPTAVKDDYKASFGQLARTSLARLMAVKFFEIHQEFQLEEMAPRLRRPEDQPAPRQWLHASGYNVFEVPPHFTAGAWGSTASYEGQRWLTGVFETTSWYELQLVINPGNGKPGGVGPVDYNYHPGFIRKYSGQGRPHPMRYYRAAANVYQVKSFSGDAASGEERDKKKGFRLNQQGPYMILPWEIGKEKMFALTRGLDDIEPGLSIKMVNSMLTLLATELEKPENHPGTYRRSKGGNLFTLDTDKGEYNPKFKGRQWSQIFYRTFLRLRQAGFEPDPQRIHRLLKWCETAWPKMPWEEAWPEMGYVSQRSAAEKS